MPAIQTLLVGAERARFNACLSRLASEQVLPRIWKKDASLWSADPAVQRGIRNRLGWLTIAKTMRADMPALQVLVQQVREAGFTHAVVLGMGGSSLFSEVCANTFGPADGHLRLTVLDSTDPTAVRAQRFGQPLERLLAIVSSKSGSTSEVEALLKYFYDAFKATGDAGQHCIAVTDEGTALARQAADLDFRRIFTLGPERGADVGGRFSALTYFGLVSAALLGIDVPKLLTRATDMFDACGPQVALDANPAAQLGVLLGACWQGGRDKLTLLCSDATASFGTWVEQLVAENLGKSDRGIAPIIGEGLLDASAYGSDRVFVELQLDGAVDETLDRHARLLEQAQHPVIRIRWQERHDLGAEVAKWELGMAITGYLMAINPFDEPNVKESKDRTKALLDEYTRTQQLPATKPLAVDGPVHIFGAGHGAHAPSMAEAFTTLFDSVGPRDYAAVLSFLPRTDTLDAAVGGLRRMLGARLGCATMLGFGPRYLHSTGQLFKGGPDGGIFLLLTADETEDLLIPGEAFSFGVLKHAQALGDFQAMADRGRRILRVHLRGEPVAALEHVRQLLDQSLTSPSAPSAR